MIVIYALLIINIFQINHKGISYAECEAINNVLKRSINKGTQFIINKVIKDSIKKNCYYIIN